MMDTKRCSFMDRFTGGLTQLQLATVMAVFILSLCGAIVLAFAFRWWNAQG